MNQEICRELPQRKTKIVVTIGPVSRSREVVRELILAGMNIARLNFSHGTHEEHTATLKLLREEAKKLGAPIAVFQDLCGPKIRIGHVENDEVLLIIGNKISLKAGRDLKLGTSSEISVEAFDPAQVLRAGEKVLLSDGQIELVVENIESNVVNCRILSGGKLRSRSGIAVPDSKLEIPCLTEKDLRDVEWGVKNEIDYIALSFVSSTKDIMDLRGRIQQLGADIPIIAKIERASALDAIGSLCEASDGIMVARGDLGLELPLERVPGAQKLIIETANLRGTPVITATQMLQSMVQNTRPTRAEVSDVYTAVLEGTDAVMLSEETAIGNHPVLAVQMLDRILRESECEFQYENYHPRYRAAVQGSVADAVCFAACGAATKISASAIVSCTQSGNSARLVAKYRPHQSLFGATSNKKAMARMALYWGVEPVFFTLQDESTTEDEITLAMLAIRDQYGLKPGARVVVTAGLKTKTIGSTTLMEIREIPRIS